MAECAQWDQKAAKYMEYIKQVKESKSEDKMTVIEDAFQQTLTCYTNLDRLHPDPVYKRFIEKIEKAIRAGKGEIFLYGEKVSIKDYFKKASTKVAQNALIPMRKSMREDGMDADVVLLAGGGAEAYQDAARELFPKSRIVLPEESVASNARGFWFCG